MPARNRKLPKSTYALRLTQYERDQLEDVTHYRGLTRHSDTLRQMIKKAHAQLPDEAKSV